MSMANPYKHCQTFAVSGAGNFPLDMLRYDACWPASESDALRIQGHFDRYMGSADERNSERRITVTLRRHVEHPSRHPTTGRWESFGWRVLAETIQTEKL
jgi:hypothetical protein